MTEIQVFLSVTVGGEWQTPATCASNFQSSLWAMKINDFVVLVDVYCEGMKDYSCVWQVLWIVFGALYYQNGHSGLWKNTFWKSLATMKWKPGLLSLLSFVVPTHTSPQKNWDSTAGNLKATGFPDQTINGDSIDWTFQEGASQLGILGV